MNIRAQYLNILIILITISCNKYKNNEKSIISIEYEKYSYLINNIEGYYIVESTRNWIPPGNYNFIANIRIEENELIINEFNIINKQNIIIEKCKFSLKQYIFINTYLYFTNDDYQLRIEFNSENTYSDITLIVKNIYSFSPDFNEEINFKIGYDDINILKYTYDYQNNFTGIYILDSFVVFGNDANKINKDYIRINIDEKGFLFIEDYLGKAFENKYFKLIFENKDFEMKIIDNESVWLHGDPLIRGKTKHSIIFFNNIIIEEIHYYENEIDENSSGYKKVYKKLEMANGT